MKLLWSLLIPCVLLGSNAMAETMKPAEAILAGGCFWCFKHDLGRVAGVVSVTSGYSGGTTANPTYETYHDGNHVEAVQVLYDPAKLSYRKLIEVYYDNVDPFDDGGQFCDRGEGYRPVIFVANAEERKVAGEVSAEVAKKFGKPVKVDIRDAKPFWAAEEYHQKYIEENPLRYELYRRGCGRDARLDALKGK